MNKLLVTSILFLCFGFETIAQISTSSPYSRFGLGDLHQNILPSSIALGGSVTRRVLDRLVGFELSPCKKDFIIIKQQCAVFPLLNY